VNSLAGQRLMLPAPRPCHPAWEDDCKLETKNIAFPGISFWGYSLPSLRSVPSSALKWSTKITPLESARETVQIGGRPDLLAPVIPREPHRSAASALLGRVAQFPISPEEEPEVGAPAIGLAWLDATASGKVSLLHAFCCMLSSVVGAEDLKSERSS